MFRNQNELIKNHVDINEDNVNNVSIETSLEKSSNSTLDASNTSNDCGPKKITIQLSSNVWRTIEPIEISSKRKREGSHKTGVRKYLSLQPGLWTNIFANEIAKHDDIPCRWVFKRNKCYLSGDTFLVFDARCNMCSATLVGSLKKKPEKDEAVKIPITISNINMERHKKEAKLVKLTCKSAHQLYLPNKKATVIKRNLLKDSTKMFTAPTSKTMTGNAIRCAQYRQRLNEKISACPVTAITYLKSSNLFMNCIQRIGLDPFYVFYCTPEQMKLFHVFNKKNQMLKVSCDATGSIVHKIGKKRAVYHFK